MKYGARKAVEEAVKTKPTKLAWAVLMKGANGRSEVIKVTDHDDADQTIKENPGMFYKSGPFVLA
jgi:hypothetical protein